MSRERDGRTGGHALETQGHNTHSMDAISMLVGRVGDEHWTCFDYSVPVIFFIVVLLQKRHRKVK